VPLLRAVLLLELLQLALQLLLVHGQRLHLSLQNLKMDSGCETFFAISVSYLSLLKKAENPS
jgi:hypothetical protein